MSLQSKGLSSVFSNAIVQKHQFFSAQPSLWSNSLYMTTGKTIALTRRTFASKVISLLFNMLSRFVTAFLPRSKHLLMDRTLLSYEKNYTGIVVVQLLTHVWLFTTPWTAARQASLSFTISWSLLKLMSTESIWKMRSTISSSVDPFSSCLQSFPASGSFPMSWLLASGGQDIGASASASVLPKNIQSWFPLGWTGLMSLQSKGLSRVFSNTTVQKHQFFGTKLSSPTLT